jgi:uncharacterized protein (TIGR03066 family)
MRSLSLAVVGILLVALTSVAAEEKKADNKALIVGVWELSKGESLPPGAVAEFAKDGKCKLTVEPEKGKKITIEGTYEIKDDSIVISMKDGEKVHTETLKISKLDKDELTVVDEKKKADSFKRKK